MFSGHFLFRSTFMIAELQERHPGVHQRVLELGFGLHCEGCEAVQTADIKLDGDILVLESHSWTFERLPLPEGVDISPDCVPHAAVSQWTSTIEYCQLR